MFCSKCGNEIQDGNAFCTKCGAPLTPKDSLEGDTERQLQNVLDEYDRLIEYYSPLKPEFDKLISLIEQSDSIKQPNIVSLTCLILGIMGIIFGINLLGVTAQYGFGGIFVSIIIVIISILLCRIHLKRKKEHKKIETQLLSEKNRIEGYIERCPGKSYTTNPSTIYQMFVDSESSLAYRDRVSKTFREANLTDCDLGTAIRGVAMSLG